MYGQNNLSENEKFTVLLVTVGIGVFFISKVYTFAKHTYSIHDSFTKKILVRLYIHVATVHTILKKNLQFTAHKNTLVLNKLTLYIIPQSVQIIHLKISSVHSSRFTCPKPSPNKQSLG